MKAFYFSNEEKKLGYGDGRDIVVGETHKVDGTPKCCEKGLHGSKRIIDALQYASSSNLYLVEISQNVDEQEDKICGKKRKYIAHFNVESVLREFARRQAMINIEKVKPYTDKYDLIVKYLETGDEGLRSAAGSAAWSAASLAAGSAARSAAWSAAESAAWSAAWSAAKSAAGLAARSAAESTAWSAAESAAWSAAGSAAWSAAWSAARSAAWSAARSAANTMLTEMIKEATGWDIT